MPSLVRIGSVDVSLGEGQEENLMDYSLSKSAPTMETVEEVMQLFESGGQVRQTYKVHSKVWYIFSCSGCGSVLAASFLGRWL